MRRLALALALLLAWAAPAAAQAERTSQAQEVRSPGGIVAWLVHEPKIPMLALRFAFDGGGALDPAGKAGLANLVASLLDEGAGSLDALAFQTRLEELAVKLDFDSDRDFFYGSLTTLTRNRAEAMELLRLALSAPRFDPQPLERMRQRIVVGLTRDLGEPQTVAARTWYKTVFGEHPYWHPTAGTVEGVRAVTREDLQGFVAERFARETLTVSAVGDITAEELGPLLDRVFGRLPAKAAPAAVPAPELSFDGGVRVERRETPQSAIFLGMPGLKRDDPDWYVAYLLNTVLGGGGLTSRLYQEVREERGLAYSVYTYLSPMREAGLLLGGAGTRNEKVAEVLEIFRAELARLREEGITAEELADARTYINGSFPLGLTSNARIADLLVAMQLYDLPRDYPERRPEYFNRITLADVQRVARRLLRPELMQVVVVGDPPGLE